MNGTTPAIRNGSIEYARFLGALGIVWFHLRMPGGATALAALQLFILLQVYFGIDRDLLRQARRILVPWILWSLIYAFSKVMQAWLMGAPLSSEFERWMLLTGPSIHLWYLPFSFLCIAMAHSMVRNLPWPIIYPVLLSGAAASLLLTNMTDLQIPFAQWSSAFAAAVIGILAKGPVSTRVILGASAGMLGFAVYGLGWTSAGWQTLVATALFFVVIEIRLPSTKISKKLSELSFGIYLVHPAIYAGLVLIMGSGGILRYALVVCVSMGTVVLLKRFSPLLV